MVASQAKRFLIYLLRIFFKLLYHQFAFAYDWVSYAVSIGKWQAWVQATLPYVKGQKILEIGYGPGHLLSALSQKSLVAFGLDESRQMGRIAHTFLLQRKITPNLVRGSALMLPFSGRSFDQVIMTFPAEFLLKPPTFGEIDRVLVDEGTVIILPYAWITGKKPLERFAAWVNHITGEAPDWNEKIVEHLQNHGFHVEWQTLELQSSKLILIQMKKLTKSND